MQTKRRLTFAAATLVLAACTATVESRPEAAAGEETATPDGGSAWEDTPVGLETIAEAMAIAEAYLEARNAYDVDRAKELVSDDFRTIEPPDGFRDVDTMELAFAQHQAYGFHYAEVDCADQNATPERVEVACQFLWTTELHRIGDHPPTPETFTIHVEDGRITSIAGRRVPADGVRWWNPFVGFLALEHPEFRDVVMRALDLDPEPTSRLLEQLPEYLELYEESITRPGSDQPSAG
jgi:hypothetical protein